MKTWKSMFVLLSVLLSFTSAKAAFVEHLTWTSTVEQIDANTYQVNFICTLDKDWHVYSQFTEEGGPMPTEFRFEKNSDIELIGKVQEIGKMHKAFDDLFGVNVSSFAHKVTFAQKLRIKKSGAVLKGEFDGQVCKDEEGCMPFGPEKFNIIIDNTTGNTTTKDTSSLVIKTIATETPQHDSAISAANASKFDFSTAENSCSITPEKKDSSNWWILFAGFVGGLLALLTPCVFPMVPLTVSFFTKGGKDQKAGLKKALIYGASIIVIYLFLGILITGVFGSDALNAMSTNIWFNLIFFVVFIAFALSFFGLYEITLPSSWANKTDSLSSKGGNIGIFFMAFTLALVSFSCTGPIIGTLLVQAATGGGPTLFGHIPLKPLVGMFGFALALALPFTLFALFPQWLKSLPKSGGWMGTVKVILGFLELALAFKFLSVVDMTMGWGILRFEPFMIIWIIIFGALALYELGLFSFSKNADKPSKTVQMLGIITAVFTAYLAFSLYTYKTIPLFSGLIPPTSYNFKTDNSTAFVQFKDYEEGIAYARKNNMPVLLDFTGFGCVNCRKIEDKIWSNPGIEATMKKYVVISLYVDDKTALPESAWYTSTATGKEREVKTVGQKWSDFQARHFQTNSQPLYVLINPKEQLLNHPVAYDFASDVDNYQSFLQCGLTMFEQLK